MPPRSTPPVRGGSSSTRQGARCSNGCFAANRVRGSRPFFVAPSPGGGLVARPQLDSRRGAVDPRPGMLRTRVPCPWVG